MTGSLAYNRQHSLAAGHSNVDKMERPTVRRWSSADHSYSFDIISEDKLCIQRNQTPSDFDSGVEDADQQNGNDDETINAFAPCVDDDDDEDDDEGSIPPVVVAKQPIVQEHHPSLVDLARSVPDVEKKEFCENTMIAFHGEFASLIFEPLISINENFRYHLFAQEEVISDARYWPDADAIKLDNAKTQFQCQNPVCCRLWTSARGRIAFVISTPQPYGFIVLKIFEQKCEKCHSFAQPLWYTEEVCRVMKNLSNFIFARYFPSMVTSKNALQVNPPRRRPHHDPQQRPGNMTATHNKDLCVACLFGYCFM